jgi:1-acyl-sn-glycerol-3-phosphate acyltransferase
MLPPPAADPSGVAEARSPTPRWPPSDRFYRSVVTVAVIAFRAMGWSVAVSGAEHVPVTGPAVLAFNHASHLDFLFLGYAAREQRRLVRFMAMQEAFGHPVAGPLLRGMRHIPVDRRGDPAASFHAAVEALRRGEVVGVHPEGKIRRSGDGAAKTGAVRMAVASGAPLLPAAVSGTRGFLGPDGRLKIVRGVGVRVAIGDQLDLEPDRSPAESTARLMERIAQLESPDARLRVGSRS